MDAFKIIYSLLAIVFVIMSLSIYFTYKDKGFHSLGFHIIYAVISVILIQPFNTIILKSVDNLEILKASGFALIIIAMNVVQIVLLYKKLKK